MDQVVQLVEKETSGQGGTLMGSHRPSFARVVCAASAGALICLAMAACGTSEETSQYEPSSTPEPRTQDDAPAVQALRAEWTLPDGQSVEAWTHPQGSLVACDAQQNGFLLSPMLMDATPPRVAWLAMTIDAGGVIDQFGDGAPPEVAIDESVSFSPPQGTFTIRPVELLDVHDFPFDAAAPGMPSCQNAPDQARCCVDCGDGWTVCGGAIQCGERSCDLRKTEQAEP
ncbi:MAG: hypothetical protein GY725_15570 [bacterium]|nr:hypothetical protein [bacterium]